MITCVIIVSRGPPRSAGVMKKPSAVMKTRSPAAATPGRDKREVDAPEGLAAARARAWRPPGTRFVGICCMTDVMVRIASGIRAWTIPDHDAGEIVDQRERRVDDAERR